MSAITTCSSNSSLACFNEALLLSAWAAKASRAALLEPVASCSFRPYSAWSLSICASNSSKRVLDDELRKPWPSEAEPNARPSPSSWVMRGVMLVTSSLS
ncbi:hypothetical protein D3C73_1242460 [compost metagenome]